MVTECYGQLLRLRRSTSASGQSGRLLLSASFSCDCDHLLFSCFVLFFCVIAEGASFSWITRQWLPSVFFVFLWVPSNFWVSIMQNVFENRNLGWWVKGLTLSQFCECKVDAYGFLLSGITVSTYCFLVWHRGFLMLSSSSYYTQGLLHSVNVYFHI